jgi:hypothetical protein
MELHSLVMAERKDPRFAAMVVGRIAGNPLWKIRPEANMLEKTELCVTG